MFIATAPTTPSSSVVRHERDFARQSSTVRGNTQTWPLLPSTWQMRLTGSESLFTQRRRLGFKKGREGAKERNHGQKLI